MFSLVFLSFFYKGVINDFIYNKKVKLIMGFISFLKSLFSKKVESNNEKLVVDKVESVTTKPVETKPVEVLVEEKTTAKEIKAAGKKVESTEVSPSKPKRKYKPRKKKAENTTEVKPEVKQEEKPKARKPRRRPAKKKTGE